MSGITKAAIGLVCVSLSPVISAPSSAAPTAAPTVGASAASMVAAKTSGGSLRVVAQGLPQGQIPKITVASKKYRKKLPSAGRLRNLPPGTYRVWATPIVTDGGTSAVPDLPVRVKVGAKKRAVLRLQYTWNPRSDVYPPGPASGLEVTSTTTDSIGLRWRNGQAPDLQAVAIRRTAGSQAPNSLDEGVPVAVEGLATQVLDTDVRSHTVYSYSVFMVDTAGNASRPASVTVRTLGEATGVTAGNWHTCDLLVDPGAATATVPDSAVDLVECWGGNDFGQLGNATNADSAEPVLVDLPNVVQVAAGGDHTCARQGDGHLWCWGRNDFGQLGQGDTRDSNVPLLVELPAVKDVAVGGEHTCAILTTGGVRCFGRNDHGQVGITRSAFEDRPVPVPLLAGAESVAAGFAHTCVVLENASVRCWGRNDSGQLGNNGRADSAVPVRPPLAATIGLTAGVFHTCALLADTSVSCWGANTYGQVGDGGTQDRLVPSPSGLSSVLYVDAGAYHSCATLSGGTAYCWGRNTGGRLGDGTTVDRDMPTRVSGLAAATAIAGGAHHSCAVTQAKIVCWGAGGSGQLGAGDQQDSLYPVPVLGF